MLDQAAQDVEDLRLHRDSLPLLREQHRPQVDPEIPEFIGNWRHHRIISVSFRFHHDAAPLLRAPWRHWEERMRPLEMVMAMALAAGTAPAGVSFVLDGTGGVIVPVTIGGLQDLRFLLDTGSTRSVVSEPVAQQLALRAVARTEMVTTAGVSMAVVAALPRTCLAMQCIDDALAIVSNNALDFGSGQLGGILGGDMLGRGDFTIDYKRRRFEWGGGTDEQRHDDRLPMSVEDGRPIVTLPQAGGRSLRVVADSGADAFVLFDSELVRSLSRAMNLKIGRASCRERV